VDKPEETEAEAATIQKQPYDSLTDAEVIGELPAIATPDLLRIRAHELRRLHRVEIVAEIDRLLEERGACLPGPALAYVEDDTPTRSLTATPSTRRRSLLLPLGLALLIAALIGVLVARQSGSKSVGSSAATDEGPRSTMSPTAQPAPTSRKHVSSPVAATAIAGPPQVGVRVGRQAAASVQQGARAGGSLQPESTAPSPVAIGGAPQSSSTASEPGIPAPQQTTASCPPRSAVTVAVNSDIEDVSPDDPFEWNWWVTGQVVNNSGANVHSLVVYVDILAPDNSFIYKMYQLRLQGPNDLAPGQGTSLGDHYFEGRIESQTPYWSTPHQGSIHIRWDWDSQFATSCPSGYDS